MDTKHKLVVLTAMLALAVLPACWTYSLHPLYEDNDQHLIYDPALEGKWQHLIYDPAVEKWQLDEEDLLVITGDPKSLTYTLQFVESSKKQCDCGPVDSPEISFEGHVVQLGPNRFLDAFGDDAGPGAIAAHNFFKVIVKRDSMALVPASDSWLCGHGTPDIGECIDYGDFLFTSPTQALQDFIQKHGSDEDLFDRNHSPLLMVDWHRVGKPGDSK